MAINSISTPLSALQSNQFRQDVTANNIANVNTDGFKASTVTSADNAYINSIGTGTQITGTYAPPRPGAMAVDNNPQTSSATGMTELSNTDLVTEMTNMQAGRNAYSANTVMARTVDDMSQTLIDLKR